MPYEMKPPRITGDMERGNEFRQALREPGAPRDEKLQDMIKKRITLPKVSIQKDVNDE